MQDNTRKITKIIDELIYYVLRYGASNVHVDIDRNDVRYYVVLTGNYDKEHEKKMRDIERMLESGMRDKSVEAEFWELMGLNSSSFDSELQLIGMMVHSAKVEIGDNDFRIEITKSI